MIKEKMQREEKENSGDNTPRLCHLERPQPAGGRRLAGTGLGWSSGLLGRDGAQKIL